MTALIEEPDLRFLAAVEERLFSAFLVRRGRASARELAESPRHSTPRPGSLARTARRAGMLSRAAAAAVLADQRKTGRPFADSALAIGALSPERLAGLLALQRLVPEALAGDLVARGSLTEEQAKTELQQYYSALGGG
jgi:hypothetical protein